MLHVSNSRADDATHSEKDAVAADSQGVAHEVDVVVHASAEDVLDAGEVLPEDFAVQTSQQTVLGVYEGLNKCHGVDDVCEEGSHDVDGLKDTS